MNPMNGESAPLPRDEPLLDVLLREALPEIKLALGDLIDRENERALPERYHRLLPGSTLQVEMRPDAWAAIQPVAREVERELSDSCSRHGSLYDRSYRVRLREAEEGVPLFRVRAAPADEEPAPRTPAPPSAPARPAPPAATAAASIPVPEPTRRIRVDADATRVEGVETPAKGWDPGRWILLVEDTAGRETSAHPLREPSSTVGRRSSDPDLLPTIDLPEAPHVSRRQLALVWEPRGDEPGFRVYNLGLNAVHLDEREIAGARVGRGPLRLEDIAAPHNAWLRPGEPLRIGESGPVLRVRPTAPAVDPDATVLG